MSEKEAKAVKLLDTKLDKKLIKTLTVCTVIMLIAILIHDGDPSARLITGATPFPCRFGH